MAIMTTIDVTSTDMASSVNVTSYLGTAGPSGKELSFVFAVVESLGTCTVLTEHLVWVLKINIIVQAIVTLPSLVGATLTLWKKKCPLSSEVRLLSIYDLLFVCSVLLPAWWDSFSGMDEIIIAAFQVQRVVALWCISYTLVAVYRDDEPRAAASHPLSPSTKPFPIRRISKRGFAVTKAGVVVGAGAALILPFVHDHVYGFVGAQEAAGCGKNRWLAPYGLAHTLYAVLVLFFLLPLLAVLVANAALVRGLRHIGDNLNGGLLSAKVVTVVDKRAYAEQVSVVVKVMNVLHGASTVAPSFVFFVPFLGVDLWCWSKAAQLSLAFLLDALVVLGAAANLMFSFVVWHHFRRSYLAFFRHCKCRSDDDDVDEQARSPFDENVWEI